MKNDSIPKMTTIPQLIKDAKKRKIKILTKRILSEKFGYNESQASVIFLMISIRFKNRSYSEGDCPKCRSSVNASIEEFDEIHFNCQDCDCEFYGKVVKKEDCINIG